MLSINEYINQLELRELMSYNIDEGLISSLKSWGNKFFNWLFKGNKSNSSYTKDTSWEENGYGLADGVDLSKIQDIKTYFNQEFKMENLVTMKSVQEPERIKSLIKNQYTKQIFKGINYGNDLTSCNLIYVLNKDDDNHILENNVGLVFYNIDKSVQEASSDDMMNDKAGEQDNKKNKEETSENVARLYIKLFYIKDIYFKLNKQLAKEIANKVLELTLKQTVNEIKNRDYYTVQLPLSLSTYKNIRDFFRGKSIIDKKENKELDIVQYKLKY